jgi:AcrR family transcriptional regulator
MPRPSVEVERRRQILTAACEVIATVGVPELRLNDVATLAGVSSGTVHYYFESKRAVLAAAFEFNLTESLQRREALLASDKSSIDLLLDLVDSYLPKDEPTDRAWKVWLALWAEAARDPVLREVNDRLYDQWRGLVADVVKSAQAEGSIRPGRPKVLANMLIGMLDGLAVQLVIGSEDVDLATVRRTIKSFVKDFLAAGQP